MQDRLARWAARLDLWARSVGALGVALLALMVAWTVFARYVLAQTPRWSEELPRLVLVWVTFFGVVSAFARGTHFEAGIAHMAVRGPRARAVLGRIAALCSAAFLLVLLVTGVQITRFTWHHQTTALSLPGGLFYLCLPVGAALSLVALALREAAR